MSNLINILEKNNYELTKEDIENNKDDIGFAATDYDDTALMFYLRNNKNPSMEIIKLLEKEKDIFVNYSDYTPLMSYCSNDNIENLNPNIINYFSNQIGFIDNDNYTSLIYYLRKNKKPSIDIIKLLEKEKDIKGIYNKTSLMFYCDNDNIENLDPKIIEYFSNQIGLKNIYDETSLKFYLQYNKNPSIEIVKLLEKEKDIYDDQNDTPLMGYCMNKNIEKLNPEIIEYFSNQICLKNINEENALKLYLENNENSSIEIVKLLEKI